MSQRLLLSLSASAALIGCSHSESVKFRQADADRMAIECGAPTTWAKVLEDGRVSLEAPMTEELAPQTFESATCLIEKLTKAEVELGFVGNDRLEDLKED